MFDIGWTELLVIGVVALIVVGPKDLPGMFRTLGKFTAKAKRMARDFQRAMEEAADESGIKDAASDLKAYTNPRKAGLDALKDAADTFGKWEPGKSSEAKAGKAAADADYVAKMKANGPAKPAAEPKASGAKPSAETKSRVPTPGKSPAKPKTAAKPEAGAKAKASATKPAAKKPAAEKPATKKPAAKKPAARRTTGKPATPKPAGGAKSAPKAQDDSA